MGRSTRIVERLHLRADSESAVRRALPSLEDAFRTATLPDVGARLIFVRRLNLGRLPRGASAQSLSLLLESRFTEAHWRLVHAGDAGSEGGQAVWFRDSLEAHELAALHVAAGRSVDAWFWPLAVPALASATSPADKLRVIAFALAAQDEAPAALPAWVTVLVRAGHGERLIAALRPGDGTALRHAAGVTDSPAGGRIDFPSVAGSSRTDAEGSKAHPARSGAVSRGGSAFTAPDDRIEFVERMSRRTIGRPMVGPSSAVGEPIRAKRSDVPNLTRPQPARRADAQPPTRNSTLRSRVANAPASIGVTHPTRIARGSAVVEAHTRKPLARDRYSEPTPDADQTEACIAGETGLNAAHIDAPSSPWAFPGAAPTAAGGLLFLVPTLERLGFGEWCAKCDAAHLPAPDDLARQIFHVLLSRLRIAEDDPAWQLAAIADEMSCAPLDEASRASIVSRINELASAEAWRRAPSLMPQIHRNVTIPEIWLAACRRWLRRRARIGLATLVVRPARIELTGTHVDVFFALNAADVRVRPAGLDIDPGWVPWFAKVVQFHYQDRPWT